MYEQFFIRCFNIFLSFPIKYMVLKYWMYVYKYANYVHIYTLDWKPYRFYLLFISLFWPWCMKSQYGWLHSEFHSRIVLCIPRNIIADAFYFLNHKMIMQRSYICGSISKAERTSWLMDDVTYFAIGIYSHYTLFGHIQLNILNCNGKSLIFRKIC